MAVGFVLIRHAPIALKGVLYGKTDCGIAPFHVKQPEKLERLIGEIDLWLSSPAKRCLMSFEQIVGADKKPDIIDARLWEQDFGDWEAQPYDQLPDIGNLSGQALGEFTPPNGESYNQLAERTLPIFQEYAQSERHKVIGVMAHAGVIRSILGHALGNPVSGLRFVISELSATRIGVYDEGQAAISYCNDRYL